VNYLQLLQQLQTLTHEQLHKPVVLFDTELCDFVPITENIKFAEGGEHYETPTTQDGYETIAMSKDDPYIRY